MHRMAALRRLARTHARIVCANTVQSYTHSLTMDFAFDQADKKLKKESKQRAAQKKREAAKRKAAAAKAKRDKAEADARLAAKKVAQEEEDAALGTTATSRARKALAQQTLVAAASDGWLTQLDGERFSLERRHIECRAVTAQFLRRLTERWVTEEMKAKATAQAIAYLESREARSEQQQRDLESRRASRFITGRDVHKFVIKEHTHEKMCRYVELAGCGASVDEDGSPSVGNADAFVSWNWDSNWNDLLEALEEHTARIVKEGGRAPRYWLDIFAVSTSRPRSLATIQQSDMFSRSTGQPAHRIAALEVRKWPREVPRVHGDGR